MRWVIRDSNILARAISHVNSCWQEANTSGKPLEVICQPENIKRSSAANRYYWDVLRQISEQATDHETGRHRYSPEVWHEYMKRQFIGVIDLPGGGGMAESSASLTVQEFSDFTKGVESYAASELGVVFVAKEAA